MNPDCYRHSRFLCCLLKLHLSLFIAIQLFLSLVKIQNYIFIYIIFIYIYQFIGFFVQDVSNFLVTSAVLSLYQLLIIFNMLCSLLKKKRFCTTLYYNRVHYHSLILYKICICNYGVTVIALLVLNSKYGNN